MFLCRIFYVFVFCVILWFFPLLLWVFCLLFSHNQKEKFMETSVDTVNTIANNGAVATEEGGWLGMLI